MDAKKVKLVVKSSKCHLYQPGDEIYFDESVINKEKSGALCMTALNALYPFVFAGRKGVVWEETLQCTDCAESVEFVLQEVQE